MTFLDLGLASPLASVVSSKGYLNPTPIQIQAIPIILQRNDLVGIAQTGTGKTAAFALPIIQNLLANSSKPATSSAKQAQVRCLVLTPTRELAIQVADSFRAYSLKSKLKTVVVYGGVGIEPQKRALSTNTDILVATPGRLLDLVGQRLVDLSHVEIFTLDEADRMFDMGFIRDVKRIVAEIPINRQTLLFSATMPSEIASLAKAILKNPQRVQVAPQKTTAENVTQQVYHVEDGNKLPLLKHLLMEQNVQRTIVFVRTKHSANKITEKLRTAGVETEAFHSNKSQNARQRSLLLFKKGAIKVLVATDIAARGLDIDNVDVVVNYDIPEVAETYVHRIGRTGRAQALGRAWTFCVPNQQKYLLDVERAIKQKIPVVKKNYSLLAK